METACDKDGSGNEDCPEEALGRPLELEDVVGERMLVNDDEDDDEFDLEASEAIRSALKTLIFAEEEECGAGDEGASFGTSWSLPPLRLNQDMVAVMMGRGKEGKGKRMHGRSFQFKPKLLLQIA